MPGIVQLLVCRIRDYGNECIRPRTLTGHSTVSGCIRYWTSAVRNILAMEQFSRTTLWTWDSRCGGTMRALRARLVAVSGTGLGTVGVAVQ